MGFIGRYGLQGQWNPPPLLPRRTQRHNSSLWMEEGEGVLLVTTEHQCLPPPGVPSRSHPGLIGCWSCQGCGFPCLREKGCLTAGGGGWDWKLLPALAPKALVAQGKACVPFCRLLIPDSPSCARTGRPCGFWRGCLHPALPLHVRGTGRSWMACLGWDCLCHVLLSAPTNHFDSTVGFSRSKRL